MKGIVPQAVIEQRRADALAERICRQNHLSQIANGDCYRCQFCRKESPAVRWIPMDKCPLCGAMYDAMLAQEEEE
jgi:rubrerythrin